MGEKNSEEYFTRKDAGTKEVAAIEYGLEEIPYFLKARRYREAEILIVSAILSKRS